MHFSCLIKMQPSFGHRGLGGVFVCLVVAFVFVSRESSAQTKRLIFKGQDEVLESGSIPNVIAVRTSQPPKLDGKLDDECWESAKPISGFWKYGSENPASVQTIGYVLYDETNIYVGLGCLEPHPESIKAPGNTEPRQPHDDGSLFANESVEIMLKPNHNAPEYCHFVTDISGATWDAFRTHGGGTIDPDWNSAMTASAFRGDGYWSIELRVPFYCLGVARGSVRSDWRINLCRIKQSPRELSTIAREGQFYEGYKFACLRELNIDFSPFFVEVSKPKLLGKAGGDGPSASAHLMVKNNTGIDRSLRIELRDLQGSPVGSALELEIGDGQEERIELGSIRLEADATRSHEAVYEVISSTEANQAVVTDVSSGRILSLSNLRYPTHFAMLELDLVQGNKEENQLAHHPLTIEVSTAIDKRTRREGYIQIEVSNVEQALELASQTIAHAERVMRVTLDRSGWPTGKTEVRAKFLDASGETVCQATRTFVNLPQRKDVGKKLNNLVTELINTQGEQLAASQSIQFVNPRNGWIYFAATGDTEVELLLDGERRVPLRAPGLNVGEKREAMRFVSAGAHTVAALQEGRGLEGRSIPELAYWRYPTQPHLDDLVAKELAPVLNCIGVSGRGQKEPQYQDIIDRWNSEGKRLVAAGGRVPSYHISPLSVEKSYQFWEAVDGYSNPKFDAIIVDEFGVGDFPVTDYPIMTKALRQLTVNRPDKLFYPFVLDIHGIQDVKPFMEAVIENGAPLVWEWYEREEPSEKRALAKINDAITQSMVGWNEFLFEAANHLEICLGYYNEPPESLNNNPAVDFKVWMDLQFHKLATHPAFDGLYGFMEYNAKRCDEETLRWQAKLYRHYGMEGQRSLLSKKYGFKYDLTHLRNPDFDSETEGWTIHSAEEGSVGTDSFPGLGRLQGRVRGATRGDNYVWLRRSTKAPNLVVQEVRDLKPGQLYSLKMFSVDRQDLVNIRSAEKKHALTIRIDGATEVSMNRRQIVFESARGGEVSPYSRELNPWFNYHRRLFRATGTSATLVISDWGSVSEPVGEIGQEIAINFVELQPYLESL